MKESKKNEAKVIEKVCGGEFTIDESLNKYKGPQFEPLKLKGIKEKFSRLIIIHK